MMNKHIVKKLFILYLLGLIFLLTYPTSDTGIKLDFYFLGLKIDHWIHGVLFFPFMVFSKIVFNKMGFIICLFIGISFSAIMESLHYFLPYREFSLSDFYANMSGIILGSSAYLFNQEKY